MANKGIRLLGVVLVIVGVVGFFNNPVFGIFDASTAHNIILVVIGLIALVWSMMSEGGAKNFGKLFGVIFLVVAIIGFVSSMESLFGLVLGGADNFMYLVVGLLFLYAGFSKSSESHSVPPSETVMPQQ